MNGDATDLTPEEWQQYRDNARRALHSNPKDSEALEAIRQANTALSAYDEAEAASPGERIQAGVSGGLKGLGEATLDLASPILHPIRTVQGIGQTIAHPIETAKAIGTALTSDDPERIARTVGNLGSALAPFAKATGGVSFPKFQTYARPGLTGIRAINPELSGPSVGSVIGGAIKRTATAPVRAVGTILEGKKLSNELLRARIADLARRAATAAPGEGAETSTGSLARRVGPSASAIPPAAEGAEVPVPAYESSPQVQGAVRAIDEANAEFRAGKITAEELAKREAVARGQAPPEAAQPIAPGAPGTAKPVEPIAGTYGGHTVEGPPTPAPPTAPTAAEMVTGRSNAPQTAVPSEGQGAVPVDSRFIANSFKELEDLVRRGIPREQIKINYYTRGGQLQQSVPPLPQVSPTGPIASNLTRLGDMPYEDLLTAAKGKKVPPILMDLIRRELARRGTP